jgi:uncharacterized protein
LLERFVNRIDRSPFGDRLCWPRLVPVLLCLGIFLALSAPRAQASTCTSGSWISIHAIQTSSPCVGSTVTTTGIVTAVLSDGFYIQNSDSSSKDSFNESWDSDTCTSEGIFVYTPSLSSSTLASMLSSGYHVEVTGLVQDSNTSPHPGTQIYIASPALGTTITKLSTGNSLPSAISSSTITTALSGSCSTYSAYSFGQWLPFQGMRVNVPSSSTLLVTQGTGGTVDASAQTATSNGQFWGTITTTTRPFREKGIDVLDEAYIDNSSSLSGVTTWDANPALMLIDSKSLGGTALNASAGTKYTGSSNLIGIVDYHVSTKGYTGLLLTSDAVSALSTSTAGNTPSAASARQSTGQITFATLDLDSLQESETNRVTKLANAIVNYMHSPDVVAVQGATSTALGNLVTAVSGAGGPSYSLSNLSTTTASCTTCYYNAFLVNDSKFDGAPTVAQALAATTYTTTSNTTATLFDRSPLVLTAKIPRTGISDYTVYLVNANLMDRAALAASSTSADARNRRAQQAELIATQILEPLETAGDHVMLLGGLNSFEFSDGYVDTLGILAGSEAASGTVWLYDATINATALINATTSATNLSLSETNPATSRYTYVENGSAEQPDHILYTSEMSSLISIDYARIGADFPVSSMYTTSTVARATSHDAILAYLTVPYPTKTTVVSAPNPSVYDESVTLTATVAVTDDDGTVSTTAATPDSGTVSFTYGSTALCSATLSSGTASCAYSKLPVGTDTITASYSGSESGLGYQASTGTTSQVVDKDTTTLAVSGAPNPSTTGEPVAFTITASSSGEVPTGTVTLTESGTTLGTGTLSSGTATVTTSALTQGTHTIMATYTGDTTNTAATATTTQTVNANTTTLTLTPSSTTIYYAHAATLTATALGSYGTPTGTVSLTDTTISSSFGTGTLAATSTTYTSSTSVANSALAVGTHTMQATYTSDGTHAAASSNTVTVTVLPTYATTSTLSCSPLTAAVRSTISCTDTVTSSGGTPSGTITYYDGTTALGTAVVTSGTASFSTSSLAIGNHTLSAVFAENDPYLASTSNTQTVTILSSFTLTASPSAQTIYTGEATTYTLTATPGTDFIYDIALTCSGLPANTTCSLSPATISGGSGTAKLTMQTTAPAQSTSSTARLMGGGSAVLACLFCFVLPRRWRKKASWLALLLVGISLGALFGCGGSSSLSGGTPTGSYTVTVTGVSTVSSVTITESTTVTLNVKSLF